MSRRPDGARPSKGPRASRPKGGASPQRPRRSLRVRKSALAASVISRSEGCATFRASFGRKADDSRMPRLQSRLLFLTRSRRSWTFFPIFLGPSSGSFTELETEVGPGSSDPFYFNYFPQMRGAEGRYVSAFVGIHLHRGWGNKTCGKRGVWGIRTSCSAPSEIRIP